MTTETEVQTELDSGAFEQFKKRTENISAVIVTRTRSGYRSGGAMSVGRVVFFSERDSKGKATSVECFIHLTASFMVSGKAEGAGDLETIAFGIAARNMKPQDDKLNSGVSNHHDNIFHFHKAGRVIARQQQAGEGPLNWQDVLGVFDNFAFQKVI